MYRQLLDRVDVDLASARPAPAVWSALEYTCHVRDVLFVQRERAVVALFEWCPSFARMYRDERVATCGYLSHPLPTVLDQLAVAAELCATVFDSLSEGAWRRPLEYNWPSEGPQDMAWLGRHTVHECEHHRLDIGHLLGQP